MLRYYFHVLAWRGFKNEAQRRAVWPEGHRQRRLCGVGEALRLGELSRLRGLRLRRGLHPAEVHGRCPGRPRLGLRCGIAGVEGYTLMVSGSIWLEMMV